jgi:hypothetical protein
MFRQSVLTVVIGVGLALSGVGWAQAVADRPVSAPGWRVVQNLGPDRGATDIAATGQSNAWAVGSFTSPQGSESLFVERWNGRAWHAITVPRRFTGLPYPTLETASVSGPSATSALVVVTLTANNGVAHSQYGLIWNGHTWSTTRLASIDGPAGVAAFGDSDMWVFELGSRPYALRHDGKGWRRTRLPAYPLGNVTALSASDIWLAGSATSPDSNKRRVPVAMHWDGKAWSTLRLPSIRAPHGGSAQMGAGMIGLGPSELMTVAIFPAPCCGGGLAHPGITVVRWNGKAWHVLAEDRLDRVNGPIVADGHGGMWIAGLADRNVITPNVVHYGAGKFTRQVLKVGGDSVELFTMFLIPGTRSVWAAGATNSAGLILRYVI